MGYLLGLFCFCFLVFAFSSLLTGSGSDSHEATLEIAQVLLSLGSLLAGAWPESSPKAEPLFLSGPEAWCLPGGSRASGAVLTGPPPVVHHTACSAGDVWTSQLLNVLFRNFFFLQRVLHDQWDMTTGLVAINLGPCREGAVMPTWPCPAPCPAGPSA